MQATATQNGAIVLKRLINGADVKPEWLTPDVVGASWIKVIIQAMAARANGGDVTGAFFAAVESLANRETLISAVMSADDTAEPDGNAPRYSWQFMNLKDAYAPRPPIEYIVKGVLAVPSVNIWYAQPGALKTNLLESQAMCIATGQAWLAPAPEYDYNDVTVFPTVQAPAPVMWIDLDSGQRTTKERLEAFGRAYDADPDRTPFHFLSMPEPGINLLDSSVVAGLIAAVQDFGVKALYLDSLVDISGGIDENSTAMAEVIAGCRKIADACNCTVNIIHHERKIQAGVTRRSDSMRGSSSINGKTDYSFLVKREDESDIISVIATKQRGAPVPKFSARWGYTHKKDAAGMSTGELHTAWFDGVPAATEPGKPADKETPNIDAAIRAFLDTEGYANKTALVNHAMENTGCGRNAAFDVIKSMELAGVIVPANETEVRRLVKMTGNRNLTKSQVMKLVE